MLGKKSMLENPLGSVNANLNIRIIFVQLSVREYNIMTCFIYIKFITEELFTKNTNITG